MNQKTVLIMVVVIALLGTGYFLLEPKTAPTTNIQNIVDPGISSGQETADWETYRNNKYGIELKYPAGWTLTEKDEQSGIFITSGYPSLQVSLSTGKFFELGCLGGSPTEIFPEKVQNGGQQISGNGNATTINFSGMKLVIEGINKPVVNGGETFGYRVYRCNKNNVCAIFFGYGTPIEDLDKKLIESLRFLKNLDEWDSNRCDIVPG